jgi:aryl-phospho-beta-D-glucosidase BglC (GH1 family)
VTTQQKAETAEQQWMSANYPGYANGVSFGGLFVIEDWMFTSKTKTRAYPEKMNNHQWSQSLTADQNLSFAYATYDCHLTNYLTDDDLDTLAAFGYNAVRLPIGYWVFDSPDLYPDDKWSALPKTSSARNGSASTSNAHNGNNLHANNDPLSVYGVNPDGFVTSGTRALSDMVVRLHNRNMRVIIDMHAAPGCTSPQQSYAGILCESHAPNGWNGKAEDGVSGGHTNTRAKDGKTWMELHKKLVFERVLPWIKFIDGHAPGTVVGYETVNEPDISNSDAKKSQVRCLTT